MCVCFSSACDEWTVLPRPGLHRDVNRFGHSAVVSNGWVSSLLPCSRTLQQSLKTTTQICWTTELQSCKYPSVHDALFAGTFLTFLDFFLQCPLSFGDTERLSGLSHFPEISQFCCVDCFGTHLFISVLNLVSVFCHVFCWESCCSHLLHPADIWMFPQLLFLHPLFIDTVYTCTLLPPEIYLYLPPFFESVYLYLTRIVKLVFPSSCCGFYKNLTQREKKGHQRTTKSSGLFIGL